ncbi:CPBP family glutamic-type intramembrane protease [Clostridium cadaveris]|uniref:CPBP family glutamic-type intramembrane protease n=1 Tax=Clostridium cadaveris TaxID=1529 RepID=UPI0031DDEF05
MKFLDKVDTFLRNLSTFKFIVTITLSMFLCSYILDLLINIFNIKIAETNLSISQAPLIIEFLAVSIIAPLLETFLFQYGAIKILRKINILKNNNLIIILISALIFGLQHCYSLSYIIHTTILGIFLSYAFVVYETKKVSPFWVVCIIHSLRNFISFSIINILKIYNLC